MLRNIVSNIRNVSVTPILPCVNSKLDVYCERSLHGYWTCKTDFRYGVVNNGPSNLRKCVEPTGTHAASTERTTKHWRISCNSEQPVRAFNIYIYIYIFQIMYAAWQDVLSSSFWKISALFSKSRLHEHLQLVRFKKTPCKTAKIWRYYHIIIHDKYIRVISTAHDVQYVMDIYNSVMGIHNWICFTMDNHNSIM